MSTPSIEVQFAERCKQLDRSYLRYDELHRRYYRDSDPHVTFREVRRAWLAYARLRDEPMPDKQ